MGEITKISWTDHTWNPFSLLVCFPSGVSTAYGYYRVYRGVSYDKIHTR